MLVGGILIFSDEMSKSEKLILEAFMKLKKPALISCEFDTANDYLAGYVSRFLSGERFSVDFNAFSKSEYELLNQTITKNFCSAEGKDLLSYVLLTKLVCNILNKYKVE